MTITTNAPTVSRTARRTIILCVAGALMCWQSLASAVTVTDGTFADADWTINSFSSGSGGTSTAAQVGSGGNPGSYRNVTDTLTGGGTVSVVASVNIYGPFTYTPAVSGPIGSINYSEDAACVSGCFGSGQSTGPAVLQAGNFYALCGSTVITGPGTAWVNHALTGLSAADFGLVALTSTNACDATQHPNFSAGGSPIQVGFFRANGTGPGGGGYTLAAGIDNWSFTILAAAPTGAPIAVPGPGRLEMTLLALAVALFGFLYVRRAR